VKKEKEREKARAGFFFSSSSSSLRFFFIEHFPLPSPFAHHRNFTIILIFVF